MMFVKIIILAIVQGACELLPVSSSAHVIIAEKLMGIDPTAPSMTLLLVMLHTGTMLAVIAYFWKSWKESYFQSRGRFLNSARLLILATAITGAIGLVLMVLIEKVFLRSVPHAQVEMIFGNLGLISLSLAVVGVFIIYSARRAKNPPAARPPANPGPAIGLKQSAWVGAVQALCLPFRGFSRSGATISTGLAVGLTRRDAEEFSFALVVLLTPPVVLREVYRLLKAHHISIFRVLDSSVHQAASPSVSLFGLFLPGIVGMAASFVAGILALRWLSSWLEGGRWSYFGYYCLAASAAAFSLYFSGF